MSTASRKQIGYIKALGRKRGLEDALTEMAWNLTRNRTATLEQLTYHEADAMIKVLKGRDDKQVSADIMRKKIIGLARDLGWIMQDGKADMPRIDHWCRAYGIFAKPLQEHAYEELPQLVTQFERMAVEHFPRSIQQRISKP